MEDDDYFVDVLQTWDQAGERPYEVLKELGMFEFLMKKLSESSFDLDDIILYRGSSRNQELNIGDIKTYEYPTSWSFSKKVACNFIDGCENKVIFCLSGDRILKAIVNRYNSYGEEEVIIAPFQVMIESKRIKDGIIYLESKIPL